MSALYVIPPSKPAFPEQNMCFKFGTYHGFKVRCQPYSQKGYCASAKSDSSDGEMSCCPHIPTFLILNSFGSGAQRGDGDQPLHLTGLRYFLICGSLVDFKVFNASSAARSFAISLSEPEPLPRICPASST
jgi:hypothetical protein